MYGLFYYSDVSRSGTRIKNARGLGLGFCDLYSASDPPSVTCALIWEP
jgi:hypothetical protein